MFNKPKISERLRALAAEQQLSAETAARAGLLDGTNTARWVSVVQRPRQQATFAGMS